MEEQFGDREAVSGGLALFKRGDNDQCTFFPELGVGNQLLWHIAKIAL